MYNPETERLVPASEEHPEWPRFTVGQKFVLNGVTFEITRIKPTQIRCKPLGRVILEEKRL